MASGCAISRATSPTIAAAKATLAAATRPIDPAAVEGHLGLYSQGFQLRLDRPDDLRLVHDIRSLPVLARADGSHIVAGGPSVVSGKGLTLATGSDGTRTLTIDGFDPVRWLSGG